MSSACLWAGPGWARWLLSVGTASYLPAGQIGHTPPPGRVLAVGYTFLPRGFEPDPALVPQGQGTVVTLGMVGSWAV